MYVRYMSVAVERVQGLAGALLAELAALPADLNAEDRMAVADLVQHVACALPGVEHRMLAELQASSTPKAFGATSWRDVFSVRWRIAPKWRSWSMRPRKRATTRASAAVPRTRR